VLWYKYWLETRFLAVFMVLYAMFPVALFALTPRPINAPQGSVAAVEGAVGFFAVYYSMIPVLLAGSGIKAQAGPRMTKGLYGSTYFTLSLPVSRFRLIATRAGIGMLETVGIFAIAPCAVWIMFPPLRAHITGSDLLLFWVTLFMCSSAIYFLGVLLSTILEDSWRGFASMFGVVFSSGSCRRVRCRRPSISSGPWAHRRHSSHTRFPGPAWASRSALLPFCSWSPPESCRCASTNCCGASLSHLAAQSFTRVPRCFPAGIVELAWRNNKQ
jgi:ABC-2 type transport system permease protein